MCWAGSEVELAVIWVPSCSDLGWRHKELLLGEQRRTPSSLPWPAQSPLAAASDNLHWCLFVRHGCTFPTLSLLHSWLRNAMQSHSHSDVPIFTAFHFLNSCVLSAQAFHTLSCQQLWCTLMCCSQGRHRMRSEAHSCWHLTSQDNWYVPSPNRLSMVSPCQVC